jgi:DNA repair exonuclease SbcCD nuclease subunit
VGRVDEYRNTVLDKLETVGTLCQKMKIDVALQDGDWFHIKRPNAVSHSLVRDVIRIGGGFPCPIWTIKGNHDVAPDGSIDRQPLGVLQQSGVITILEEAVQGKDFWLIPRPYNAAAEGVHDGEVQPEHYSLTDNERKDIQEQPAPVIGLSHGSIVGPGDTRPYPHVQVDTIPGIEEYDLFISGHLHENLGVVPVGDKTLFANPGSIARTSRNLPSYTRDVGVLIVDINDKGRMTIEEVPLPGVKPALEVFGARLEDKPVLENDAKIAEFVAALGQDIRAEKLSWEEMLANLPENVPAAVLAEVQRLLEESEG